jgi:hypothetical protein
MKNSQSAKSEGKIYNKNSKLTCLKHISRPFRNIDFHREYILNYCKPMSEILTIDTMGYLIHILKNLGPETY